MMATGPEHYREAERLIAVANRWENADTGWMANMSVEERLARRATDLAEAHVHATLADAAATAMGAMPDSAVGVDYQAWNDVAGVPVPKCIVCGTTDGAALERQRDLQSDEPVWLCGGCHADATGGALAEVDDEQESPVYPAPGSEIPGQPGYVVGTCEHRVAGSEWRAGLRTCERCPGDSDEDLSGEARCRVCGCTENEPCDGGCSWVPDPQMGDLCSACAPTTALLAEIVDQFNAGDITPYDAMSRVQELLGGRPANGEVSDR